MKPIDFRNETFRHVQERICEKREAVWRAWLAHGPGTTREVAARAGIDILNFRPRTTELFQIGALKLASGSLSSPLRGEDQGEGHGREGIYEARTTTEWQEWYDREKSHHVSGQ